MEMLSNAKLNLGLSVIEKRSDGFHNIESLFIPIPWYDKIQINTSDEFQFKVNGLAIEGDNADNTCVKAYQIIKDRFQIPAISITLEKNIPMGAGLGGGSSNAAFIIKAINELFDLKISIQEMEALAAKIGSDCTFFIRNQTAFVSGVGDKLEPLKPQNRKFHCLVINPNIHINTAEAYALLSPKKSNVSLIEAYCGNPNSWSELMVNDFEAPILSKYPMLSKLKKELLSLDTFYVTMSGSGSTFYALSSQPIPILPSFANYQFQQFDLEL